MSLSRKEQVSVDFYVKGVQNLLHSASPDEAAHILQRLVAGVPVQVNAGVDQQSASYMITGPVDHVVPNYVHATKALLRVTTTTRNF